MFLSAGGRADSVTTRVAGQAYTRRYRYTAAGLLDSVHVTGGGIAFRARKYVYDQALGTLTEIRLGSATTVLKPNREGRDTSITFPGGDRRRNTDYALHRPAQISSTAAYNATVARSVSFDPLGRITAQVNGTSGRRYTYDERGRLLSDSLIEDTEPSGTCEGGTEVDENGNMCLTGGGWAAISGDQFAYDSAGNRTDKNGAYLTGNRITQFDGCSYTTDDDGNVRSRNCAGQTVTIRWTAEGRLDTLVVGGVTFTFDYDASGRLIRKKMNGTPVAHFLWDGAHLLAELTGAGTAAIAEYSYYPGLDNSHAVIVGEQQYNAHKDAIGNAIALTDTSQVVKRTYGYDAWGQLTGGSDTRPFNNADRARFKGALWVGEETELYYMRARWYEPKTGRFLSEDPLGVYGGINLYTYASDDPINGNDPRGLCPEGSTVVTETIVVNDANEKWLAQRCRGAGGREFAWWELASYDLSPVTVFGNSASLDALGWSISNVFIKGSVYGDGPYATWDREGGQYVTQGTGYGFGLGVTVDIVVRATKASFAGHSHGLCGGFVIFGCITKSASGWNLNNGSAGLGFKVGLYWVETETYLNPVTPPAGWPRNH